MLANAARWRQLTDQTLDGSEVLGTVYRNSGLCSCGGIGNCADCMCTTAKRPLLDFGRGTHGRNRLNQLPPSFHAGRKIDIQRVILKEVDSDNVVADTAWIDDGFVEPLGSR